MKNNRYVLKHSSGGYKKYKGTSETETTTNINEANVWVGSAAAKNARPIIKNPEYKSTSNRYYIPDPSWTIVPVEINIIEIE